LSCILVTHAHADHTAGVAPLRRRYACRACGPADPCLTGFDETLEDGAVVGVGGMEIQVMAVPGHTRTHLAYYCPSVPALFCGDMLFVAGCGRILDTTPAEMWNSLKRLRDLPGDTLVYCGHEYTIENLEFALSLESDNERVAHSLADARETIDRGEPTVPSRMSMERLINPFLRADDARLQSAVGMAGAAPQDVFAMVRGRKDRW